MAATLFTKELVAPLDVTTPFKELMQAAVGKDSIYIRAKETMNEFLANSNLSDAEKATQLSQMLVSIGSSITDNAMSHAVQIAKDNRDAPYSLAKVRADTQLINAQHEKVLEDTKLITSNKTKVDIDTKATTVSMWKMQADMYTKNGIDTSGLSITNPILTAAPVYPLADDKVKAEGAKAATYSKLASTRMQDGNVTVSKDSNGDIVSITPTTGKTESLTGSQINVAIRQEKAFDDNMRQHAANSSSTMIGMLLSTENSNALSPDDVVLWRNAVTYLSSDSAALTGSISITGPVSFAAIDGFTVTGTSVNTAWGANVHLTFVNNANNAVVSYKPIGIIDQTSTAWSVIIDPNMLTAGTYRMTAHTATVGNELISDTVTITVT